MHGEGDIASDLQAEVCKHISGMAAGGHVKGKFNKVFVITVKQPRKVKLELIFNY